MVSKIEKACHNIYYLGVKVSVVIPAFNEEKLLGACVEAVRAAFAAAGPAPDYEIIVCNNNSSDKTAEIAAALGAKVVFEPLNQMGAARNTGAAAAAGLWLIFLDADSVLSAATLRAALGLMRGGAAAGGGALIGFFPDTPWWALVMTAVWNAVSRWFSLAAGSFMFCRADAFRAVGGFDRRVYAGEELLLSRAVRRWGRTRGLAFRIITAAPHLSSSRTFFIYGFWGVILTDVRIVLSPFRVLRSAARLPIYYDVRR